MSNYLNLVTEHIWKEYESKLIKLGVSNEYRILTDPVLERLCKSIHLSGDLIQKKVLGLTEKKARFKAASINFKAEYRVNRDGTSDLELKFSRITQSSFDKSFLSRKVPPATGYVYFVKSEFGYKIGKTKRLNNRMRAFGVKLPFDVELHSFIKTDKYSELEKDLHKLFKDLRLNGEWFELSEQSWVIIDEYIKEKGLTREEANNG